MAGTRHAYVQLAQVLEAGFPAFLPDHPGERLVRLGKKRCGPIQGPVDFPTGCIRADEKLEPRIPWTPTEGVQAAPVQLGEDDQVEGEPLRLVDGHHAYALLGGPARSFAVLGELDEGIDVAGTRFVETSGNLLKVTKANLGKGSVGSLHFRQGKRTPMPDDGGEALCVHLPQNLQKSLAQFIVTATRHKQAGNRRHLEVSPRELVARMGGSPKQREQSNGKRIVRPGMGPDLVFHGQVGHIQA